MKKLYILSILGLMSTVAFGQQHGLYSQYIFNLFTVNPAYAGERDALSTALSYRMQWVGFEGAPKTQNFSIHSPLPANNMAVGLTFQNEDIGARSTPSLMGAYSYKVKLNRSNHLSFALQAGVINYQYHWEKLEYRQSLDPVSFGTEPNKWVANIDFGVMYITPKAYVGLSVLGINDAKTISSNESDARLNTVYNFMAGKMFQVSREVFIKPSTLVRVSDAGPFQFDLNMSTMFKNKYWLTATYRYNYGAVISGHIYVNDQFHFGYAYDLPLNGLLANQSGTHELFVGYDFNIYKKKAVLPRKF